MGVDLRDLTVRHPLSLESLKGRIIVIDAFNILYQFLASIRQEDGTPLMDSKGRITGHLSGLFYRTARLVENGVKPIYAFDGVSPKFKSKTSRARAEAKRSAEERWIAALERGELTEARIAAQATGRLTPEMVGESMELLAAMGIPFIQAPSEGEAQAAVMVQKGLAYASASQDYDSLLFGSPLLVRNISITGKRKVPRQNRYVTIEPEEIRLDEVLSSLGITRDGLIMVGLLIGTDYNDGVKGIGPKTALKIVKQVKNFVEVKHYVKAKYNYEFDEGLDEIYDFFLNPPYAEVKERFEWGRMNYERLKKILCDEHDFAPERVERVYERMAAAFKEYGSQQSLGQWF